MLPAGGGARLDFDHVTFAYRRAIRCCTTCRSPSNRARRWLSSGTPAGKSSIVNLLLRYYEVKQGAVRIDGVDLGDPASIRMRRAFGTVLQDPFIFSGTLAQNIGLGDKDFDRDAILQACREVGVEPFIQSLEQGLDKAMKERGATLSAGQRQLVSFARALAPGGRAS